MMKVEVLQSFDHAGPRRRGERFHVSRRTAEGLERNGLVRIVSGRAATKPADPSAAAGTNSSASPAARASRRKTSKPSDAGETPAVTPAATVQTSATEPPQDPLPRRRSKKADEG